MDFDNDELQLFGTERVPMMVNDAGQYTINVSKFPNSPLEPPASDAVPTASEHEDTGSAKQEPLENAFPSISVKVNHSRGKVKDYWEIRPIDRLAIRHHLKPRRARFTPCHTQCPVGVEHLLACRVTKASVIGQSVEADQTCDMWTDPHDAHRIHG